MNCLSARPEGWTWSPFFCEEDYKKLKIERDTQRFLKCKVYHDGTHAVALPITSMTGKRKLKSREAIDDRFDELYLESVREDIKDTRRVSWIYSRLDEEYPEEPELKAYVEAKCKAKIHNSYARRKRFRRKAYLHEWNYFVTFTYSDALHDEESFRTKLRKCLSNLHTRHGWRYMGVPEYSPETHRLHYHMLIYVPEGEMVGELREVRDYSTKYKRMQTRHVNSFFEERYGRNDFEPLDNQNFALTRTIDYILKYMEKDGERVIYSRGIPTELQANVGSFDVAGEFVDFVYKMVLFDSAFDDCLCIFNEYTAQVLDERKEKMRE